VIVCSDVQECADILCHPVLSLKSSKLSSGTLNSTIPYHTCHPVCFSRDYSRLAKITQRSPEEELLGLGVQDFYSSDILHVTPPTVSKHWRDMMMTFK